MPELRRISLVAVVLLVVLRISIGWQFLYEGLWKLDTQDTAKPWSAEGYLKNAAGPFRDNFRGMVEDPDDLLWLEHDHVSQQWNDWKEQFITHYDLTEDQQTDLEVILEGPENYWATLDRMPQLVSGKGLFDQPVDQGINGLMQAAGEITQQGKTLSQVQNPTPEQRQQLEELRWDLQAGSAEIRLLGTIKDLNTEDEAWGKTEPVLIYDTDNQRLVINRSWHMTPLEKLKLTELVQERISVSRNEMKKLVKDRWPVIEADAADVEAWGTTLAKYPTEKWQFHSELKQLGAPSRAYFQVPRERTDIMMVILDVMVEVAQEEARDQSETVASTGETNTGEKGPLEAPRPEETTADEPNIADHMREVADEYIVWTQFAYTLDNVYTWNARLSYREKLKAALSGNRERVGFESEEQAEKRMGQIARYKERLQRYEENLAKADQPFEYDHLAHDWKEIQELKGTVVGPIKSLDASLKKDAQKILTEEQLQQGAPKPPSTKIGRINSMTIWSLIILGLLLITGFATRMGAVIGAGMVLSFYLVVPPWPGVPEAPGPEHSFIVNKNFIEVVALLAIAALPTGTWFGLDNLVGRLFRKVKEKVSGKGSTQTLTPPAKTPKDGAKTKAGATTTS